MRWPCMRGDASEENVKEISFPSLQHFILLPYFLSVDTKMLCRTQQQKCMGALSANAAEIRRCNPISRNKTKRCISPNNNLQYMCMYTIFNNYIFRAIYSHRRDHPLQAFRSQAVPRLACT